jgi:hypothetical protein
LQKVQRPLCGVEYAEEMSERLLKKPLSEQLYRKEKDGPTNMAGFVGYMLDGGGNVLFETSSGGGKEAINALGTAAIQATAMFDELVHPVVTVETKTKENSYRTYFVPKFVVIGYVSDKRAREVDVIADEDILTRPPTPSRAKVRRERGEAPAI